MDAPHNAGDLSLQQLNTFCIVYEHGGYSAAAQVSHMSVPTVWHHIRELERVYDTKLFKKTGRQIQATEAATRLYQSVIEILTSLNSTFELVKPRDNAPIRIVTGVRMMMEDLAAPLAAFRTKHQNAIRVRQGNDQRAEQLILDGHADLGLALAPSLGNASSLIHYEPAYKVDFLAVSTPDHPFASSKTTGLRELVKHALVVTTPGTHGRDALDQALHEHDLTANIAVETDNSGFTISCVTAGMGLGILAGRKNGRLLNGLKTKSLRRQLGQRKIVFMWQKGRMLSSPQRALIQEIKEHHAS